MDSTSTDPRNLLQREPLVLTRAEHPISRKYIDENALRVLYRLSSSGFLGYLCGGGVRDLFLEKKPKDFDVATDAKPSRLKKIFKNCRIIGRRFRIAHVYFPEGKIIEVSTFRRGAQTVVHTHKGVILRDNEYGTPQEDALRRDLTINGLFYDINTFSIIDYVGGVQDLRDRIIRTISDPDLSFREDPVRMIRVQRHAARTGFQIEENTYSAIIRSREEIHHANGARLLEEMLKDLRGGAAAPFFRLMMETKLFDNLLPPLSEQLGAGGDDHPFWRRMQALDRAVEKGACYTTPLLLSLLLHTILFKDPPSWSGTRNNPPDVWRCLTARWRDLAKCFRISRRDTERITQILISFRKLSMSYERGQLLGGLQKKPYLSEALDFFELDLESQGKPAEIIKEWRGFAPPPPLPEHRYRVFAGEPAEPEGETDDGGGEAELGPELLEEGATPATVGQNGSPNRSGGSAGPHDRPGRRRRRRRGRRGGRGRSHGGTQG